MWKLNGAFAIFTLLSFSQLQNANAVMKYLEQSYSYPGKQVMYNEYAFKDGNLVYAVCDGSTTEKKCTVIQRQFSDNSIAHSCNVTLEVSLPTNVNLTDRVRVLAFGQKDAILFWGEIGSDGSFHLMKIRMDNCKTKDLILNDTDQSLYHQQISAHKILVYNTTFDMFFDIPPAYTNSIDFANTLKRVRINEDFDLDIDDVMRSEDGAIRFISPIATRSPDKGYVYCTMEKRDFNLWLVKPNGIQKLLANHENQFVATSGGYDVITSCANPEMDPKTQCTQYDENGSVKFNATLDIGDRRVIIGQLVHNTPSGGFLLMIASIEMFSVDANNHMKPRCEIVRVNGDGKRVGSIRLDGFFERLQNAKTLSVWESKDQFCLALIAQVPRNTLADNLDVAVNCFTEDDFIA